MGNSTNGGVIESYHRGFSLIELLVALVVTAVFSSFLFTSFPNLHRTSNRFLEQVAFEEELLIFLNLFSQDFSLSEVLTAQDANQLGQMKFQQDRNEDGDYLDTSELIQYRWNNSKKRVERKSGIGNFQSLVEGVVSFSWEVTDSPNTCYRMSLQSIFSNQGRVINFCRRDRVL